MLTPDGQLIVGGFDKKLYSLNPQTGQSNWQFTDAHDRFFGGVLVVNNMIYAPNADYNLYALNLKGTAPVDLSSRPVHLGCARFGWDQYLFWHAGTESVRRRCQDRQTGLDAGLGWSRAGLPGARERQ